MNRTDFLSSLNPEQRRAVEKIYGAVLVLAGPGTGKTHLLTSRIAHILQKTDANPSNILCLTFTESAATEMRNRLQKVIGPDAYRVRIATFHGFCEWVMTEFPWYFEEKRGMREVADDLAKALAFRDAIRSNKWEYFSNVWDEFVFRRDVIGAISKLKRENVSSEDLKKLIPEEKKFLESAPENLYKRKTGDFNVGDFKPSAREKIDRTIGKLSELAELWEAYEKALHERRGFDFDDQLMWAVEELQNNENLRLDLQERFQWVLVDEYQDTNSAQNEILWQLTSYDSDPNVFVVGDDDQAIFRFQGASVENVKEFQSKFSKREVITLVQNYRSAPNILESATHVIAKNLERVDPDKRLSAGGKNKDFSGDITRAVFGSRYSEIGFLVDRIRENLSEGIAPSEIAILVRKNSEVEEIARQLPKFGIPVSAQIFQNIFEDQHIRFLILLLQIFSDPANDEKFFELLHSPIWKIEGLELLQWAQEWDQKKEKDLVGFLGEKAEKSGELARILGLVAGTRKDYMHCRPEVLCEKLLYESGLATYLTSQENGAEHWAKMHKFLELVREQKCDSLSDLLEKVDLYITLQIPVRPDPTPSDRRSVQIMTAHKAKGQEFDVVFLPGLLDRVWGNPRSKNGITLPHIFAEDHDENEDERRLFFVALTRARKKIFLSHSTTDFSGKEKTPSEFWHELPEANVQDVSMDEGEENLQKLLPVFLQDRGAPLFTDNEKEILRERVKNFTWSATSLQAFLDCPRKFLFQKLYKLPRRPTLNMAFGTAMHEALERFGREFSRTKNLPSKKFLLDEFERALHGQNLPRTEFEKILAHGNEILAKYLDEKKDLFSPEHLLEFDFKKFAPSLDDIRITGKMDRIEFLDNSKTRARVVDFKSGKPRSITKGERLWRQLVFYDVLAWQSKGLGWNIEECVLEFLTPDHTGKLGSRSLEVSEEDRAQVMKELRDAHAQLQNLEFPLVPNPTNDPDIEYWQNFGQ